MSCDGRNRKDARAVILDVTDPTTLHLCARVLKELTGPLLSANSKSHELGVVLLGSKTSKNPLYEENDRERFGGIHELVQMQKGTAHLLKSCADGLQPEACDPAAEDSDFLEALMVGIDCMDKRCKMLKFRRRVFFVSSFRTPALDPEDKDVLDDCKPIARKLREIGAELEVVRLVGAGQGAGQVEGQDRSGEAQGTDGDAAVAKEELPTHADKYVKDNLAVINHLRSLLDARDAPPIITIGEGVSDGGEGASRLADTARLVKRPYPWKGELTLGGDEESGNNVLRIGVHVYKETSRVTMATFERRVKAAAAAAGIGAGGRGSEAGAGGGGEGVKQDTNYYDINGNKLDQSKLAQGHRYGPGFMPVGPIGKLNMEYESKPGLEILGTVDLRDGTRIPLWHGMEDAEVVVAEADNDAAARALSAFVNGLVAAGRVAIARFVKKENKDARIGYLAPFNAQGAGVGDSSSGGGSDGSGSGDGATTADTTAKNNEGCEALIFVTLPFKDDDRRWKFQALGKAAASAATTAASASASASSGSKTNAARAEKLLPTAGQCTAAEELVAALDLDAAPGGGGLLARLPANPSHARFFDLLRQRTEAAVFRDAAGGAEVKTESGGAANGAKGKGEGEEQEVPFSFPPAEVDPFSVFDQQDSVFATPAALAARKRFAAASALVEHAPPVKGAKKVKEYFGMEFDLGDSSDDDEEG